MKYVYICEKCKRPIRDHQGSLGMNLDDVTDYRAAVRVWSSSDRAEHIPQKPRWQVRHTACSPKPPDRWFGVDVAHVRTERMLTRRTEMLMRSCGGWLPLTDWRDMLQELALGSGRWPR